MADAYDPPPWWYVISKRIADRLVSLTPARTRRAHIDAAVDTIMEFIYQRLDKNIVEFRNNVDIDLKTPENAIIFIALLFIDICHDAGADNLIRNILEQRDARMGMDGFVAYIQQVEFIHPNIKNGILANQNLLRVVAPLINNSIYTNSKGIFQTDEHQAFCETGALMRRIVPGNPALNVFNQDVFSLVNFISKTDTVRGGVFDQSSAGTVLQAMGLMKIRPIVAIPNVADQGLNIQTNPTIPMNFGYITELFKNLVMKSPTEFSRIGRYTLGPSAYWMAQNDPNKGLGPDEASSYYSGIPCSLVELLELMRTNSNIDKEKLSLLVQYIFNENNGLLKYLETQGFFNYNSCAESKALFENLKNSNGIMDNNTSWTSKIRVGNETVLEVQYEGSPEQNGGIKSRVIVFDAAGNQGVKEESVISAATAAEATNINDTIFKTIGDNNMFLYALANRAWAMTGDKVAASQYLILSYLIETGSADVYVNGQPHNEGAKFIFESAKPSQNKIILFESTKNNPVPLLIPQTPLVDITTTDYCLGKGTYAQGGDNVRPQTGFMGIIQSVIANPFGTTFVEKDGLYRAQTIAPPQYTTKQLQTIAMGVRRGGDSRDARIAYELGIPSEGEVLEGHAGDDSVMSGGIVNNNEESSADSAQSTPAPNSASGVGMANQNMTYENNGEDNGEEGVGNWTPPTSNETVAARGLMDLTGTKRKRNNDYNRAANAMRNNTARNAARGLGRPNA